MALQGFSNKISEKIEDVVLKALLQKPLIGSIDQFSDSTDLLSYPHWRKKLLNLYTD